MTNTPEQEWVLPASIPFGDLKGRDLEECVYWLLDAMGAKDLEWRTGGSGSGAADGGRDLEAQFFEADNEGELRPQKWWVECKGRSGTVEPDAVKSAANNALAYEQLDRLIIATNTQFSNPTREWITQWQAKHPSPTIQLWDRAHLERYLSRHPDVVLRLFSEALSLQGRFQALEARFWNRMEYVPQRAIIELWNERSSVTMTPNGVFALIANEFANGNVADHPWGVALDQSLVTDALSMGLTNVGYLVIRSTRIGIDQSILFRTFAYLVLAALRTASVSDVTRLVMNSLNRSEHDRIPEHVQEFLIMPIVDELLSEMRDVCSEDCPRVFSLHRSVLRDRKREVDEYWLRFDPTGKNEEIDDTRILIVEKGDAPCAVGFQVDTDHGCPLYAFTPSVSTVEEFMGIVQRVALFRHGQAVAKREEIKRKAMELAAR